MLARVVTENGVKKLVPLTADVGAGLPVGFIAPAYKKGNYSGWLYLDGSTFDETKYPLLYAYLGSNVLPDYREFGIVGAEENTTSSVIARHDVYTEGEEKDDMFQGHTHGIDTYKTTGSINAVYHTGINGTDLIRIDSTVPRSDGTHGTPRAGYITRGKRKAVYFYIKATSGLSENAQDNVVAQLNEERSYSTEEVNTGKKWIDGKPIYKKTIDCGALPNNATKTVAHNIANLDKIIDLRGIAIQEGTGTIYPLPYTSISALTSSVTLNVVSGNVTLRTGQDRTSFTITYVTIEYTKTTD